MLLGVANQSDVVSEGRVGDLAVCLKFLARPIYELKPPDWSECFIELYFSYFVKKNYIDIIQQSLPQGYCS